MLKKMLCALLALTLVLASSVAFASEPTSGVFAQTNAGTVLGYKQNGVESYLGIPYATAERFEMPVPVEAWEGVLPCLVYGDVAPQHKKTQSKLNLAEVPLEMVENEETCLNLNVWTCDQKPETLKPVIFWIHGGGYASGSSAELSFYAGRQLVEYSKGDVVFVSVNHRLNYLGYLDLSAYGEEFKYSGNAGHADLICALEWVRDNIAKFGGDPNNVTIIGQSGGGTKVTSLMGMPAAKGLFHRAVAMSGGSAQCTRTTETAQEQTAKVLEILGVEPENAVEALKALSYDELYDACSAAKVSAGNVVDGDFYPTGTFEMSANIPFMTGTTFGETASNYMQMVTNSQGSMASPESWAWWNLTNKSTDEEIFEAYAYKFGEEYAQQIIDAFKEAYPTHAVGMGMYLNNRLNGGLSVDKTAAAMESYGGTVYQYLCAYIYPMFDYGFATRHTSGDIPMWFHNLNTIGLYVAGDEENAAKVEETMSTALINFVTSGNPSQEGLEWPAHTEQDDGIMVFDVESAVKYHHDDKVLELMTEATQAMKAKK